MSSSDLVSRLFDVLVEIRSPYLQPSTVRSYRTVSKNVSRILGDRPVESYTVVDVARYVAECAKTRSPFGVNHDLRVLKSLGHWLTRLKVLPAENPFATLEMLREPARDVRFLSPEEFQTIYTTEKSEEHRDIYFVAVTTALRLSDVLALDFPNFDTQQRTLRIRNKKTGKLSVLPVHPQLADLVERRRKLGPHLWSRAHVSLAVSRHFKRTAERAKVYGVSFHTLRKTSASWLLRKGVSIFEVSRILNHADVRTTVNAYASVLPSDLNSRIELLTIATGSLSGR